MSLTTTGTENARPTKPCQRLKGHTSSICGVIHLPDGQRIMTCSFDGSLRVWNLQTGKQIAILRDGKSFVYSMALSMDGKKVVSGSGDGIVRLWSIEEGKVIARWTGHTSPVWSVCWNQDGMQVLSGSSDGTARVWDVETGKTIIQITGIRTVYTAIFSPDSTLIAAGGGAAEDEFIKIWDANTGKPIAILKGHTRNVDCLAWTANGRTLISGSWDFTIKTWDTSTWQQLAVLTGHTNSVDGFAISPNGCILASSSRDNTARLWNLNSGHPIGSPLQHPHHVNGVSFSTDGMLLATACHDGNAYTWDIPGIMTEAGLDQELLDVDKSFLHADATLHLVQEPKIDPQLPEGFFIDAPSNVPNCDPDTAPSISPPIVSEGVSSIPLPAVPEDAPPNVQPSSPAQARSRFFRLFRSNTPAQLTILQRLRLPFFKRPQNHDCVERFPPVIDVPLGYGQPRYYSAAQERARQEREREKARQAKANRLKNSKNGATTNQPHSLGNITQSTQSHAQPSSEPHLTASSTTFANATSARDTTSATPVPNTMTLQAGCLACFLLRTRRISAPHHS